MSWRQVSKLEIANGAWQIFKYFKVADGSSTLSAHYDVWRNGVLVKAECRSVVEAKAVAVISAADEMAGAL